MNIGNPDVLKLVEWYRKISLLEEVQGVLGWDLEVNLPPKAMDARANQSAMVVGLVAEKWLAKKFRATLEKLLEHTQDLNLEEQAIVRNLKQGAKYYWRVPKDVIVEEAKTTSEAFVVWRQAREEDNFNLFLPYLKKIIRLQQVIAGHLGYTTNPYDALLELYEPEANVDFYTGIFALLKPELVRLVKRYTKHAGWSPTQSAISGKYPVKNQKQLVKFVLGKMGFDWQGGRMDVAPHPFTSTLGVGDVRITTRYTSDTFQDSLSTAMHEGGHALYEQGVNEDCAGTPLAGGVSLGMHEAQSRFWENMVGRSLAFWRFLTPKVYEYFPCLASRVSAKVLYEEATRVAPSLIRVEADELTYNLHILLRFELENDLINGKLLPEDLPQAWRGKMQDYLGVVPETDREGVLQDVHWAHGTFGYFPTYTLGNVYAAQLLHTMTGELNVGELVARGDLGTVLAWQRANIHTHGSLYWPRELIKRVTGEEPNPAFLVKYLEAKY